MIDKVKMTNKIIEAKNTLYSIIDGLFFSMFLVKKIIKDKVNFSAASIIVLLLLAASFYYIIFVFGRKPFLIISENGNPLCQNCNVILISIDSLRRDHLGLYGYNRPTSPNLDKWSEDAFVLNDYITTSYLTSMSEMSLHTSLYPSNHGMINFYTGLKPRVKTLAQVLKDGGYRTAAIGSSPEFSDQVDSFGRGFDEFYKYVFQPIKKYWFEPDKNPPLEIGSWKEYSTDSIERGLPFNSIEWLKERPGGKFFLWVPVGTIHWAYNTGRNVKKPLHFTDREYRGTLANDALNWYIFSRIYKNRLWSPDWSQNVPLTKEDIKFINDRYDDGIYLVDKFLGELFGVLEDEGLDKNTIIIIASEHGEELGEHGYFAHYDTYESGVRGLFVVKLPGMAGRKIDQLISNVDVLPTLLELLGIETGSKTDGLSFLSLFNKPGNSEGQDLRKHVFIERTPLWENVIRNEWKIHPDAYLEKNNRWLEEFGILDARNHYRDLAVRTKEWKLIYRESREAQEKFSWWAHLSGEKIKVSEYELYDLKNDPMEQENVFGKYPEVEKELKEKLFKWRESIGKAKSIKQESEDSHKIQPYF